MGIEWHLELAAETLTLTPTSPGGPGGPSFPFRPISPLSPVVPSRPASPLSPWEESNKSNVKGDYSIEFEYTGLFWCYHGQS